MSTQPRISSPPPTTRRVLRGIRGGTYALQVGPRIFLREPRRDDGEVLVRLIRTNHGFLRPWVEAPENLTAYSDWLTHGRKDSQQRLLLCDNEDGSILGYFGLSDIVRGAFQSAYLGYWSFTHCTGRGYMTEGLWLVLRQAFSIVRLHRLEANIQPDNARSLALVQRCGFRKEGFSPRYLKIAGRWRDHERWAITAEEWRQNRSAGWG